jgi:hypothetical protein
MTNNSVVCLEIDDVKKQLEHIVKDHQYDFMHPDVIAISQKLDSLILKMMKKPLS